MKASAKLTIPRMFSDATGECRFNQTEIPLVIKEYAPPASPVAVSTPMETGQWLASTLVVEFSGRSSV
jgi:hypothetical protein